MVAQRNIATSDREEKGHEDPLYRSQLPQKLLGELLRQTFHYPDWQADFEAAQRAFHSGSEHTFLRAFRKLKHKQQLYNEFRTFECLTALASLDLSFPSNEIDRLQVERWMKTQPSNETTFTIFRDMLDGLRNKDQLFSGDRSHPSIKELDSLDLTYDGWEEDYRNAVTAHCGTPAKSFNNQLHRLRQKQAVSTGDRSHWRLLELDSLSLSYPGWKEHVAEVEEWHFKFADDENSKDLFLEVVEGLKDQERLYRQGGEIDERDETNDVENLHFNGSRHGDSTHFGRA